MVDFQDDAQLDTSQIEDRRGSGGGGFGGGRIAAGGGGLGIIGIIAYFIINAVFGGGGGLGQLNSLDNTVINGGSGSASSGVPTDVTQSCQRGADANQREDCQMVAFINNVQSYWKREFTTLGRTYTPAKTVLFSDATDSQCGTASAQTGPFYCPVDKKIYLDLGFFRQLQTQFGAKGGPVAEAYVVAHEYGHHVQDLLGILDKVQNDRSTGPQSASVRSELQADCLAGAWLANAPQGDLGFTPTDQDISDALDAAAAVGDDRIQQEIQGRVNESAWTHGSAAKRMAWFKKGYDAGGPGACNTFAGTI
ncbi:MAG: neutral zinc metallopeptidase [Thermoleophilia bacterium]